MTTTSQPPLVSVIIPSFNTALYVGEAVQSVLDQTYQNLEVHVVDDGSTDNTRDVMKAFANESRVFYHYQNNRGEAGARNTGIRASRGSLIALCDADDLWMPRKLELQVPCFEDRPQIGVVYTNVVHVDINNREIETYRTQRHNGLIAEKLFLENFVTGSSSIIRRECFDEHLYDESLKTCADFDLWLRLSPKYEFFYLDEITYRYRQWPNQASNPRNTLQFFDDSTRARKNFLEKNPGLISKEAVDEWAAGTAAGRAMAVMRLQRSRRTAVPDLITALRIKPTRFLTWKAVAKVLLNRVD
jgi:glycosyltransferase involved in cell wall biosynthesis